MACRNRCFHQQMRPRHLSRAYEISLRGVRRRVAAAMRVVDGLSAIAALLR